MIDQKPRHRFVLAVVGEVFDIQPQYPCQINHRSGAVHQPGVLVTLDDLLVTGSGDQIAHKAVHQILDRQNPDYQRILVQNDGKGLGRGLEGVQPFRQGQGIGQVKQVMFDHLGHDARGLALEHLAQNLLGLHRADHLVQRAVAHQKPVVRVFDDLGADLFAAVVDVKINDMLAGGHGAGQGAALQLEHVADQVVFLLLNAAVFGTGIHHGDDIIGGDNLLALGGQAQQAQNQIGDAVEQQYQWGQQQGDPAHGTHQLHRHGFRQNHAQTLGQQVGKQNEQRGDGDERECETGLVQQGTVIEQLQQLSHIGGQALLADDAAQNGDGVQRDLNHGEEGAGLLLQVEYRQGLLVAFLGQHPQLDLAGRRDGDFGDGKYTAEQDQQEKNKQFTWHARAPIRLGGL